MYFSGNYIPISALLRDLQNVGMTDQQVGAAIGLNGSSVCRLRAGVSRDTRVSVYFAALRLWQEKTAKSRHGQGFSSQLSL